MPNMRMKMIQTVVGGGGGGGGGGSGDDSSGSSSSSSSSNSKDPLVFIVFCGRTNFSVTVTFVA
jgi:hypothetical protein